MNQPTFIILITDKNPHVRDLLKREFTRAGYRTEEARDGAEALARLAASPRPHLVVLDPEIPSDQEGSLLAAVTLLAPGLPVILHAWGAEEAGTGPEAPAIQVEKSGDTAALVETAGRVLQATYPDQFAGTGTARNGERG